MKERSIGEVIVISLMMAGAFIFIWLNLAAGPVLGIVLGATVLRMISGG